MVVSVDFDYALLRIEWKKTIESNVARTTIVELPRRPVIPKPSARFTKELLLIGYPWFTKEHSEPAQASSGLLNKRFGPNPQTGEGNHYGYASFAAFTGFSGAGG